MENNNGGHDTFRYEIKNDLRLVITRNAKKEVTANLYRVRNNDSQNCSDNEISELIDLKMISSSIELPEVWPNINECKEWFNEWFKNNFQKL
jgi:hypothetical protein